MPETPFHERSISEVASESTDFTVEQEELIEEMKEQFSRQYYGREEDEGAEEGKEE